MVKFRDVRDAERLISAALEGCRPGVDGRGTRSSMNRSMKHQIRGIVIHWMETVLHGHQVICPGMRKMGEWAEADERTARTNARVLENWGVLIPVAHAQGGGHFATEYRVDLNALFRVLVQMKANPSEALREKLTKRAEVTDKNVVLFPRLKTDVPE